MGDNPEDENQVFHVPRLEILSLRKAIGGTVRESQVTVRGNNEENEAKLKSNIQHVWFFFKQILEREEKYGAQAIRLIQALSYLGGAQRIHYGLVDLEYNDYYDYDYESKEIFNILDLLYTYGFIQVGFTEETVDQNFSIHNITPPNEFWMSVIREKNGRNQNFEMYLLQTCFNMVEKGRYSSRSKNAHFRAISPYILIHEELVKKFKKFFTKKYWDEQFTGEILDKFEEVFGQSDHETMGLRYDHLEMMLKSKEAENEILLAKCEEARVIFDRDRDYENVKDWSIAKLIRDIGRQRQDMESRNIYYEESLRWYTMIQARLLLTGLRDGDFNYYHLKNCIKKIVKILIELDRPEDIHELFHELRREIIFRGKEQLISDNFNLFGFDYFLSSLIELSLEFKNPILKKSVFGELLKTSEFAFNVVLNTQKENIKWMNKKLCKEFPNIVKNFIKCLIELDQFDQILNVIQVTDLVWQESIQCVLTDRNLEVSDVVSYAEDYLNVHRLILNICIENEVLKNNVELRNSFLTQSVNTIIPMCLSPSTLPLLSYPFYKYSYVSLVGRCLIELSQMNELVIFLNNFVKFIDSPENEERLKCSIFPAQMSEGMIHFCAMIVRNLTPLNGRVEHLQVLEKTLQITKKYLSQGRSNGLELNYEKAALDIIEVCEYNLEC